MLFQLCRCGTESGNFWREKTYHDLLSTVDNALRHVTIVLEDLAKLDDHFVQMVKVHFVSRIHGHPNVHSDHATSPTILTCPGGGRRTRHRCHAGSGSCVIVKKVREKTSTSVGIRVGVDSVTVSAGQ